MPQTYSVGDFIGKRLLIDQPAQAWWGGPGSTVAAPFTIAPGEQVVIDTYIHNGTDIWFGVLDDNKAADQGYQAANGGVNEYFIQYEDGLFDQANLQTQGVLSQDQKLDKQNKDNMNWQDWVTKWGGWVLGASVVTALGVAAIKRGKENGK
jgi:hypothetical protein